MQSLPDQIASVGRDVIIRLPEDHNQFAFDIARSGEAVVVLAVAERVAVDIRREVAHRCADALVERASIREMATETHACGADTAVAGGEGEEELNGRRSVGVVG